MSGSLASTAFPAPVSSGSYDAANELTNWAGATISYDLNGNMVSDGVHSYTWDTRNQLSAIDSGNTGSFVYDPFGRRTAKSILGTATSFLYDMANPVQELSGTTPTANLIEGGIDQYFMRTDSNGTTNFLTDALGSTLVLTDATGGFQTQYSYDPFGNTTNFGQSTTNSYTYTGRENDGTGLYYYRARYYDPAIGRFASGDPSGFVDGTNGYSYADSDPVNRGDPSGQTDVPIPVWGRWCGPNWTGGQFGEYNSAKDYKQPWPGGMDATCMQHDKCYYYCRVDHPCNKGTRATCMRQCDYTFITESPAGKGNLTGGGFILADLLYFGNKNPDAGENAQSCRKP